ncbi:hypothetical protein WJX74_010898 [Apatococcus lobatus]|uniref:Tr-type G domain-containing protein n=1 Tax=Apatococcus lobatus TaxID=904363 RepID=A0AAW1SA92_9CHLO
MPPDSRSIYNVNVGVLGHVDSGKTSLVAALSQRLSTAALDKHPQSKQRGITLDLGFSSLSVPTPPHLQGLGCAEVQFTLVDCPGHASLIRTILGGAHIIDMMLLVVDVTKGIQAQTAECLVVGEIAIQHMVVVLNKVDLLPAESRGKLVSKARKRLAQTFAATKFAGCPMLAVSSLPGEGEEAVEEQLAYFNSIVNQLLLLVPPEPRSVEGSFLFAIDHCFAIKGQGTVLTGTVLKGKASVNDTIELAGLRLKKKIKSMQMFKQPVQQCQQGDRAGICVTQLDPDALERGLACAPGSLPSFSAAVAAVEKVRFYAAPIHSKAKLHITVGHTTVMAETQFFGLPHGSKAAEPDQAAALQAAGQRVERLAQAGSGEAFDLSQDYLHQDQLHGLEGRPCAEASSREAGAAPSSSPQQRLHFGPQWALLRFEQPVTAPQDTLVIGSRFDGDASGASCRQAFYGRLVHLLDTGDPQQLQQLRIFKLKQRRGIVERISPDKQSAVCRGMFKKDTDISLFSNLKVECCGGQTGTIEGAFGKAGKFKVAFPNGLKGAADKMQEITLKFKRFMHDPDKHHMVQ